MGLVKKCVLGLFRYIFKYIVPAVVALWSAIYIFSMEGERLNGNKLNDYKISKIEDYLLSVNGLDFDIELRSKLVCSDVYSNYHDIMQEVKITERYIDRLKEDSYILRQTGDLYQDDSVDRMEDKIKEALVKLNDIKKNPNIVVSESDFSEYKDVYVKGRSMNFAVNNDLKAEVDGISGIYDELVGLDIKGQVKIDDCNESYEELKDKANSFIEAVEIYKFDLIENKTEVQSP